MSLIQLKMQTHLEGTKEHIFAELHKTALFLANFLIEFKCDEHKFARGYVFTGICLTMKMHFNTQVFLAPVCNRVIV